MTCASPQIIYTNEPYRVYIPKQHEVIKRTWYKKQSIMYNLIQHPHPQSQNDIQRQRHLHLSTPTPANPTNHFFSRRFFLGFHLKFSSRRCVYTQNTYIIRWHLEINFSTPWILLPFFLLICPSCFGRLSIPEKEKPYNLSFKVIVVLLSCQGGYN